jgi:hypothetical protein
MLRLTVSNNTKRNTVDVDVNTTIRESAAQAGVNLGSGGIYLNGELLNQSYINDTLAQRGVADESEAMLVAVKNADSAN